MVPGWRRKPWAGQWTPLGPEGGDVRSLSYDQHNPERIFLGTSSGQLFVSNDGGANWSLAKLPAYFSAVYSIALLPEDTVWIATHQGVFFSKDYGVTWEHVLVGSPARQLSYITYSGQRLLGLVIAGAQGSQCEQIGDFLFPLTKLPGDLQRLLVAAQGVGIVGFGGIHFTQVG